MTPRSTVLLLLASGAAFAGDADVWRDQLEAALTGHFEVVSGCALEPLELFSLVVAGDGAVREVRYQGFDAEERQACLAESLVGAGLPPAGDASRHLVTIRVEDEALGMPFAVEELGIHCDEQVVDLAAHDAIFEAGAKNLRSCQTMRLLVDRTLRGQLRLAYTVAPDGSVSEAKVLESSLGNARAEECVAERAALLSFPEPRAGCSVTLEQTLDFDLPGLLAREADIAERIAELKPASIRACGEKPDEQGAPTLVVKIHVLGGSVETATVLERYFVGEDVAACLERQARDWTFDGVNEGRSVVHFRMEDPVLLPD